MLLLEWFFVGQVWSYWIEWGLFEKFCANKVRELISKSTQGLLSQLEFLSQCNTIQDVLIGIDRAGEAVVEENIDKLEKQVTE